MSSVEPVLSSVLILLGNFIFMLEMNEVKVLILFDLENLLKWPCALFKDDLKNDFMISLFFLGLRNIMKRKNPCNVFKASVRALKLNKI